MSSPPPIKVFITGGGVGLIEIEFFLFFVESGRLTRRRYWSKKPVTYPQGSCSLLSLQPTAWKQEKHLNFSSFFFFFNLLLRRFN